MYVHKYVCIYVSVYVPAYIHVFVIIFICVCLYMRVYMYVCEFLYMCVCVCILTINFQSDYHFFFFLCRFNLSPFISFFLIIFLLFVCLTIKPHGDKKVVDLCPFCILKVHLYLFFSWPGVFCLSDCDICCLQQ